MFFSENLGHFSELGEIKKLPKLKLQSTLNTWVTCPVCRGGGLNTIYKNNGSVDLRFCPHCKGKKKYFKNDSR